MKKLYPFLLTVTFASLSYGQVQIGAVNYTTLRAAFTAINAGTHTGAISILITGNTTETDIATLNGSGMSNGIGGSASYTSISISPSGTGNRTILFTGSQGYLFLQDAGNITIDGMNRLTIANAIPQTQTIFMANGSSNNTIANCTVLGSSGQGIISIFGGTFTGSANNNITVTHCDIGPYDGNLPANGIYIDSGIYVQQYNATFTYNTIHDYNSAVTAAAGIYVAGFQVGFTIQNNRFYQSVSRASINNYGICVLLSQGGDDGTKIITNNEIGSANASGTGIYALTGGRFTGILYQKLHSDAQVAINDNIIKNISVAGNASGTSSNSPFIGIAVRSGLAEIKRNAIGSQSQSASLAFSTSSSSSAGAIGIYKDGDKNVDISDNTIGGISATGPGRVDAYGIYMEKDDENSAPHIVCSGNTIGGTNANSILSTSTGNATVAGIRADVMPGPIQNNIIRNLAGYGSGVSTDANGVIGIKSLINVGGVYGSISGNTIYNLTNANATDPSYVAGISENTSQNFNTIERNNIHSLVSLSSSSAAVIVGIQLGGDANLYNNMIALGNTVTDAAKIYGIRNSMFLTNGQIIYNNSIYIGGTASYGNAGSIAYYQDGDSFSWSNYDNIYVNNRSNAGATGTHSSIRVDNAGSHFNGNIYFGNGNGYVLGYNGNTPKTTLAAWNGWSNPQNDSGYFVNPHFIHPTDTTPDLHIDPTVPTMVESHGYGASGDDIDQEIRSSLTPIDIGADAGNFIGITQPVVTDISPASACTTDNAVLTITGTGFTGVTQVKIGSTPVTITNASATSIQVPAGNVPMSGNVFVTNDVGTGGSANVFNVYAPPAITQQPVAGGVCSNGAKTFSVAATGAIAYQWLLNGMPLTNTPPFSNVTTATLTVTNPTISYNSSALRVIVYGTGNVCSITSDPATLTVFQQPAPIIQASGSTTICAGSSVTLSTTVPYASYHWSNGAVTPSINVTAIGNYTVTVTDTNTCSVTSASVAVIVNPNVTYYRDADSDLYGNPVISTVSCMGMPVGFVADNTDCNDGDGTKHQTYPFYADTDGDTYGSTNVVSVCAVNATTPPSGYALNNTDCNDNDGTKHQTYPFYTDTDGDTYGVGTSVSVCAVNSATPPSGYALNNTDCNDNNNTVYRSATLYTDLDGDGYSTASAVMCYGALVPAGYSLTSNGSDCNDNDPLKHQTYSFYVDNDGDSYGAGNATIVCAVSAVPPSGYAINNTDCNDNNNTAYRSATLYTDLDGDGYSTASAVTCYGASVPAGYSLTSNGSDCDDNDPLKHQTYSFYVDNDGDSYGAGNATIVCAASAVPPSGYALNNTDCNDNNNAIYRNATLYTDLDGDGYSTASAPICYGVSIPAGYSLTSNGNDCDDNDPLKHQTYSFYADNDGDTYGAGTAVSVCTANADGPPSGYALNNTDCNDNDNNTYRSATLYTDLDGDGYSTASALMCYGTSVPAGYSLTSSGSDCDDSDPLTHQSYPFYTDADGDTYGAGTAVSVCTANADAPPSGYALNNTDCNDNDNTIYRNAGLYDDLDGDGYSTASSVVCYGASIPAGYSLTSDGSDCDDSDPSKHETYPFYADADSDTYGAGDVVSVCAANAGLPPSGYALNNTDCDDSDALKHQTYPFYADNDNDGYGAGTLIDVCAANPVTPPVWFSLDNTDCNDSDGSIHPGAMEVLYDGIDNNCDGQLDEGFQIKTKLVPADCGTTLSTLDTTIHILPVNPQPWGYRIKAVNGGNEQTIITGLPEFKMTDFASYAYATTYSISVEIMRNGGVWLGYYGDVCPVTTPTPANGIYESYAIVSSNGGSGVSYDMQAVTANPDFDAANLGTFLPGNTLTLKGGKNKIFSYGCNVSASNLYYRVYKTGTAPDGFSVIPQSFAGDVAVPGGQLWQGISGSANLLSGLANGNYTLEVYSSADFDCGSPTSLSNNNGNNYKATFSVTSPMPVVVTATLGTQTAMYANVSAAFNAINAHVHQGDIVITITGNTFEPSSGAMLFPSAAYNSILIVPQGNVTVSANTGGAAYVINITTGHDITIDGLNTGGNSLTITNPYSSTFNSTPMTVLLNNCNNMTLTNCTLLGYSKYIFNAFTNTAVPAGMTLSCLATNNVNISNCDFGASDNPHPPMYAINAWGDNYVIANNKIHDYFAEDVVSAGLYNSGTSSNWAITGNLFYQTVPRSWQNNGSENCGIIVAQIGVSGTVTGVSQGFTITGNTIGYASANQSGTYALLGNALSPKARFCGIRYKGLPGAEALPTIISNNTIASVSLTETTSKGSDATAPFVGISFESGVGTCNGNTIGSQTANGSLVYSSYTFNGAAEIYGILNLSANLWTADNNTIGGMTAASTSGSPVSIYGIKSAGASWLCSGNTIGGTAASSIQLTANGTSQLFGLYGNATGTLASNAVRNLTANTTVTGIQLDGSNNNLSRNFVHSLAASGISGIRISGGTAVCANNMIALGNGVQNAEIEGLYDTGTDNSFYNNSVYIGGTATAGNVNSYALLGNGNGARNYTNNILVNDRNNNGGSGMHYGTGISSVSGVTMNRNVYYATGTGGVLGRLNSQDINSLSAWKTATGQDSGSFFSNPQYMDPMAATPDLHINPSVASVVESNGDILPAIPEDFDGQVRSGLTPADIGADAGNFTAPPPAISGLSALSGCPGTSLAITGTNMGHVTSVTIGGTTAAITAVTAFSVTVTVGAGNTGAVSVFNADGETAASVDTFALIPLVAYYQDADGDGYGNPSIMQLSCPGGPSGYVSNNTDCDDTKAAVHPGAVEIGYNGIDDNCDGQIDEGFPPKVTVIQSAMCNTTLAAIDSPLTANLVAGAQGYRWRITTMTGTNAGQVQFLDTALRTMKITQLASYAFATTYQVEVAVYYAGFLQPFTASSCTVTTPATTTQLAACGQSLTAMPDVVYANIVPFATGYKFRVTDPVNAANTQIIERSLREFRMNLITSFTVQYGKQYNVEVSLKNTDGSWLPYGAICTLTTPAFPTTSLQDSQCDGYMVPTNATQIYAISYPGAIAYVFQLSGGGLVSPIEVTRSLRTFTLNDFAGQLTPGATYNVKARLVFNANDPAGPFGKTCTITTPGLSKPLEARTPFDAVAYPNPFADSFNIEVTTASSEEIHIKIYDMAGRQLEDRPFKTGKDIREIGDQFPSGVYNVIVSQDGNVKTLRVVKR